MSVQTDTEKAAALRLAAFNRIMGDPSMPKDQYQDRDYDEWLFNKAWEAALASVQAARKCGSECDYLCQQPNGFGGCGKPTAGPTRKEPT